MSKKPLPYERVQVGVLAGRLLEPRRFIQVVAGPRQVGKTTLVRQATEAVALPVRWASADEPTLKDATWLAAQWQAARLEAETTTGAVLVLDEIQKIQGWSETVKRLWDEDTHTGCSLRVVLLGSAPLLIAQGISESLAGRFETIMIPHWSLSEMQEAFGVTLDEYIYYGGYPGSMALMSDPRRWERYVLDSLVETSISRDVLLMTRVDKPALLRRLFELACRYSGQQLSYTKMLGQLDDAGNTVTLAHYLDLLKGAGMVCGLPKYAADAARKRGSSPKLQVFNTALMSAGGTRTFEQARSDKEYWGHLVESSVGAHLINAQLQGICTVYYWRAGNDEVDFVVESRGTITAIEVKSGRAPRKHAGLTAFHRAFHPDRILLVGGDGISVHDFLRTPVEDMVGGER